MILSLNILFLWILFKHEGQKWLKQQNIPLPRLSQYRFGA